MTPKTFADHLLYSKKNKMISIVSGISIDKSFQLASVFRSIRKWWIALPPNKRQLLREAAWRRRWHLAAGAVVLLVVMAVFLLTHLDESPVTGRTRLLVFSRENFLELADLTAEQVRSHRGTQMLSLTSILIVWPGMLLI